MTELLLLNCKMINKWKIASGIKKSNHKERTEHD